jgi:molybdopterin-guanine dinucleotide biosynthesis protein A
MAESISGIVLAGGKSSRMGWDKTQIRLESGLSLVEQAVSRLAEVADEVIVVTAGARGDLPNVRWASDLHEGAGPLGGIYTGLLACAWSHALVVACDMPFLSGDLLRYMVSLPRDYDVLLPSLSRGVEPLHAVYGKACLEPARALLEAGRYSILDLYGLVRTKYLSEDEVSRHDPEGRSFFNINTPDQLRQARHMSRRILERRGRGSQERGNAVGATVRVRSDTR